MFACIGSGDRRREFVLEVYVNFEWMFLFLLVVINVVYVLFIGVVTEYGG